MNVMDEKLIFFFLFFPFFLMGKFSAVHFFLMFVLLIELEQLTRMRFVLYFSIEKFLISFHADIHCAMIIIQMLQFDAVVGVFCILC